MLNDPSIRDADGRHFLFCGLYTCCPLHVEWPFPACLALTEVFSLTRSCLGFAIPPYSTQAWPGVPMLPGTYSVTVLVMLSALSTSSDCLLFLLYFQALVHYLMQCRA